MRFAGCWIRWRMRREILTWRGQAGLGKARRGTARQGEARDTIRVTDIDKSAFLCLTACMETGLETVGTEVPMPELQRISLIQRAEYLKRLAKGVQTSAAKLIEQADALERELKTA